jgi:tetratricopeptide (TPR) repeat protein
MLLALVMIVTTLIRTAWVGVATGIIAAFLFMNGKSVITRFQKKRTYILITVISLFVLFLLSFLLYSIKKESIQGRLFIWKVSSEHFFEKPFLGIGSNRFLVEYNNWQAEYFLNTPYDISNAYLADNVQSVYNEFLQAFIETGLVGVILFVAFCVALLWRAKILLKTCKDDKSNKKEIILISASCVSGILAMSMFSYTLHFLPLLILFVLFAGLISGTIQDSNSKESVAWCVGMKIRKIGIYSIIGIISLFFCVSMWVNIAQIKCYTEWNKAVAEYNEGNYLSSLAIYESIFPYMKNDGYFLLYYGTTLYMSHDYENAKRNLQKSKEIYIGPDSEYQIRGMLSEDKGLCNSRMSLQICKRNAPQPYVSKIPVSSLV